MEDQQAAFEAQTSSYTEAGSRVAAAHKAIEAVTLGLTQVNGENKVHNSGCQGRLNRNTVLDCVELCGRDPSSARSRYGSWGRSKEGGDDRKAPQR
jgi:hypothetical protein